MKFFTKKVQEKQNVKVDPRSQKFVDTIKLLLEEHGITNPRALNECSHQLLKTSLRFYKGLKPEDEDYNPEDIVALESNFRTILMRYGITEEEIQDEIFIGFFGTLNELGAGGLKG
jgi:hypothetical protein